MNAQPLAKILLILFFIAQTATTEVGVSFPAQLTSLIGSHDLAIAANLEKAIKTPFRLNNWCQPNQPPPPCTPPNSKAPRLVRLRYERYLRQQESHRQQALALPPMNEQLTAEPSQTADTSSTTHE